MTDPSRPNLNESLQQSISNRETMAPSGLSDSVPTSTGPFAQLPAEFGRYRVLKLLGHGAMGTVYLAFDPDLNKEVALKIPKADLAQDAVLWERFQREARAVGDLNHANICGMYEVGQISATHYISMEYIDGRPLTEFISDNLPQRKVASVIRKLAQGLAQAHERGIVHRDLKPANVMIDAKGEPKLMDFGLARRIDMPGDVRATQSGMIVGSPAYMSPEQARAEHDQIGPKTDIYGLGVLFFELLTGSLPFRGPIVVVLGQIATQLPPRPSTLRSDVDPQLESLCLKMMAKKGQDRPQSMAEVVQVLTEWAKEQSAPSSDPNVVSLAKEDAIPLAPVKPATPPKSDPIESQKQRVHELLEKHQYKAAIELLEKIVNLRDARFEKLVEWGRERLPEVRATQQKLLEASAPLCATAEKLLKRHDYAEAVKVLSSVPTQYRSPELRDLLHQATELKEECDQLEQDIAEAIQQGDADTLPALIKRLLKLKPHSKAVKQLAEDLKNLGPTKVIALRRGQRRFVDTNERAFETKHIVASVALVAGLFIGVSLMVNNYLATSKSNGSINSTEEIGKSESENSSSVGGSSSTRKTDLGSTSGGTDAEGSPFPAIPQFTELDGRAKWTVLDVKSFAATGGAIHEKLSDGSVRVVGNNPDRDTYTVTTNAPLNSVTAIKLEVLPDGDIGPGRAEQNNLVLSEIEVEIGGTGTIPKSAVIADYSQWPFMAETLADRSINSMSRARIASQSGWAVDGYLPGNRVSRSAILILEKPAREVLGEQCKFTLKQSYGNRHNLARFRLSATSEPLSLPLDSAGANRRAAEWLLRHKCELQIVGRGFSEHFTGISETLPNDEFGVNFFLLKGPLKVDDEFLQLIPKLNRIRGFSVENDVEGVDKLLVAAKFLAFLYFINCDMDRRVVQEIEARQELRLLELRKCTGSALRDIDFDKLPKLVLNQAYFLASNWRKA